MAILIVENSDDTRVLLRRLLRSAGHLGVAAVESARAAFRRLEQASASSGGPAVDLFLMDIDMPEMDAIEACRVLKSDLRFRDIPVLMVTGKPEDEELQKAFAAGASDYITTPARKLILLARVNATLQLK